MLDVRRAAVIGTALIYRAQSPLVDLPQTSWPSIPLGDPPAAVGRRNVLHCLGARRGKDKRVSATRSEAPVARGGSPCLRPSMDTGRTMAFQRACGPLMGLRTTPRNLPCRH